MLPFSLPQASRYASGRVLQQLPCECGRNPMQLGCRKHMWVASCATDLNPLLIATVLGPCDVAASLVAESAVPLEASTACSGGQPLGAEHEDRRWLSRWEPIFELLLAGLAAIEVRRVRPRPHAVVYNLS